MIMGPEPITRPLDSLDICFPFSILVPHHLKESLKQVHIVQRAGGSLGVVLNGQDRQVPVAEPFHRAVIQVYVAHLQPPFQVIGVHGVAMVLGGDIDSVSSQIPHRMVAATVSKLQLEVLGAQGFTYELMAQAYAHYGLPANKSPYRVRYVVKENRIAWA